MSDILRTQLAPVNDAAWSMIRDEAQRTLRGNLSARKLVDVDGPHGWSYAAVNLGRLRPLDKEPVAGVGAGLREVLPLVEVRVPFTLDLWELDNAERGAEDVDLQAVSTAAERLAAFEEGAVYNGLGDVGIQGLTERSPHKPVPLARTPEALVKAVETAMLTLQEAGIGGPYALVLDTETYPVAMAGDVSGYPVRGRLGELAQGGIHWSPVVNTGTVLSLRGGDFKLTLGQDSSIGYQGHGQGKVDLFFTESLTFRVVEPAAALALRAKN